MKANLVIFMKTCFDSLVISYIKCINNRLFNFLFNEENVNEKRVVF